MSGTARQRVIIEQARDETPRPGNFWNDLWLLWTLSRLVSWNSFRSRKGYLQVLTALATVAFAGWIGVMAAAIGAGAGSFLTHFPEPALDGLLPGLLLTLVMVIVLLSSFGLALGSLFLANDLERLMTAPVNRRAVFAAKLLDGSGIYYGIILVGGVPCLITYGIARGYGTLYFVLAVVAALGAPLFPASLGALLTMLTARFAPAKRVKETLAVFGAIMGIAFSLIGQTSRLWVSRLGELGNDPQSLVARLELLANLPLPSLVAGRGLAAAGAGHWGAATVNLLGYLLISFGCFVGCGLLAERLYATGWVRMQSAGTANRSSAQVARDAANAGWLGRAPAWLAIALKDWRLLPRDLRNFAQILSTLVILPIIYFNVVGGSGRRSFDLDELTRRLGRNTIDPGGIMIAGGVLLAAVLVFRRIAIVGISMEGTAWWILKSAPITAWQLLRGKLVAVAFPFAILSTTLMLGATIWRGFGLLGALYGWFGVEVLGLAILAITVGASVPWARLDWDDPRKMSAGWGTLVSLTASTLIAGLAGLALCLPVLAAAFYPAIQGIAWIIGPLLAVLIAGGGSWLALGFGASMLARVGEA